MIHFFSSMVFFVLSLKPFLLVRLMFIILFILIRKILILTIHSIKKLFKCFFFRRILFILKFVTSKNTGWEGLCHFNGFACTFNCGGFTPCTFIYSITRSLVCVCACILHLDWLFYLEFITSKNTGWEGLCHFYSFACTFNCGRFTP